MYLRIQNRYACSVRRLRCRRRQATDTWSMSRKGGGVVQISSPHEGHSGWGSNESSVL
ncbi:hypothetical protein D3C71_719300 [compost metagenome]